MTTDDFLARHSSVDCSAMIRSLYYFLDGEIAEDLRVKIELHLSECPPCVEIVRFESELRRIIAVRSREVLPVALRERVAAALDAERKNDPTS